MYFKEVACGQIFLVFNSFSEEIKKLSFRVKPQVCHRCDPF